MHEEQFKALLNRYEDGTATDDEKAFVEGWYLQYSNKEGGVYPSNDKAKDSNEIWSALQPVVRENTSSSLWSRIAVAASITVVLGAGTFAVLHRNGKPDSSVNDVAPYSAMAVLKSGGKTILLDKTGNGKIAHTNAVKSAGEMLSYDSNRKNVPVVYDTIQIPAGGRPYTVKLSDGSKLTLNAATTLRYPEKFSKNRVEEVELISGEIYADVVHNAAAPMQIRTPGQVITDIGTEFDIAAYANEPDSRTTLISGSVKVNASGKEKILSPGRQAILTAENLSETSANIVHTTAWKDGLFRFNGERIDAIMRQLARWYNVEIAYDGKVTDEVFYGVIDRKRNISEVLRILERSQKVHFKIEGRRVTVSSK